jgi:hypothetical protein
MTRKRGNVVRVLAAAGLAMLLMGHCYMWSVTNLASMCHQQRSSPLQSKNNMLQVSSAGCSSQILSHVVIPFAVGQMSKVSSNLDLWHHLPPCTYPEAQEQKPALVFHVSYSDLTKEKIFEVTCGCMNAFENLPKKVRTCFRKAEVKTLYLKKSQDKHVLGARLMFEKLLLGNITSGDKGYVLYMEPDLLPVRSNWLSILLHDIKVARTFWIKGSIFRGDMTQVAGTSYFPNLMHINGNAIYNLCCERFQHFYFKELRPYIIQRHGDSVNAYDTDFYEYLFDRDNYNASRSMIPYYVYTNLIQNQWHTQYSVSQINALSPETVLVHGGKQVP